MNSKLPKNKSSTILLSCNFSQSALCNQARSYCVHTADYKTELCLCRINNPPYPRALRKFFLRLKSESTYHSAERISFLQEKIPTVVVINKKKEHYTEDVSTKTSFSTSSSLFAREKSSASLSSSLEQSLL